MNRLLATGVIAALTMTAQAQVLATLVSQYMGTSVSGQAVTVCVYSAMGQQFEHIISLGKSCPMTMTVR